MHTLQTLPSQAYQRWGIFHAADHLAKRGFPTPSEQMASLALFLYRGLGETPTLPFLGEPSEVFSQRMSELLDQTLQRNPEKVTDYLRPLAELADLVSPHVTWDPFVDFAELLNHSCARVYIQVAERLRRDYLVGPLDAASLAHQFVAVKLPQALRRFNLNRGRGTESSWMETVFSRYAHRVISADADHRRQFQELWQARPVLSPEEALEMASRAEASASLPGALRKLSQCERGADLLRLQRLQRHGDWVCEVVRLRAAAELQLPVPVGEHHGVLAAVAHLALDVDA